MKQKTPRRFSPGLVISGGLFPQAAIQNKPGAALGLLQRLADTTGFEAFEIAHVSSAEERLAIGRLVRDRGLRLIYWLSAIQYSAPHSINALDEAERRRAADELLPQPAFAAECGAEAVAFLSGPDLPAHREEAVRRLRISVEELAAAVRAAGLRKLIMEPLDRTAHKKRLMGPTAEAVAFAQDVRRTHPDFYLTLDVAHATLMGEQPVESLRLALPVLHHIHLCNCVSDPTHPLYGDRHMEWGAPGFLNKDTARAILKAAAEAGFLGPARPIVSIEVKGDGGERSWTLAREADSLLTSLDIF